MRLAGNSSERLRPPHYRNPRIRRFLRLRRYDRDLDADGGSHVPVLPPENPPTVLLQDALTRAQSEAGESLRGIEVGRGVSEGLVPGVGWAGVGDVDDGSAVLALGSDGESPAAVLADDMQRVVNDLYADLEQLVGISADEQQLLRILGADLESKSLPLRLRAFDGGSQQRVEIHGRHRGWALFGKAEQAGHQRPGAPGVLADSRRQFALFRSERCTQQQIGIAQHSRDGIVEFMGGAAQQLADRSQFFGIRDLGLQALKVGERLARVSKQAEQFPIEQAVPDENHGPPHDGRGQRKNHAERTDALWHRVIEHRPPGKQRERKGRDHSHPGEPYSVRRGSGADAGLRLAFVGAQTDDCDPGHGESEGDVVEASGVIAVPANGPIRDVRTGGVSEAGAEQIGVENFPAAFASQPGQKQGAQKRHFLDEIQRVQTLVIGRYVWHDILPGNHDENVEIDPPNHHQSKIKAAQTGGVLILRSMRTKRQSSHQRYDVQEKNDVAGAQVRNVDTQPEFEVDPHELVGEPEAHTGSEERPEQTQASARAYGMGDKGDRPRK